MNERLSQTFDELVPLLKERISEKVNLELTQRYEQRLEQAKLAFKEKALAEIEARCLASITELQEQVAQAREELARRQELLTLMQLHPEYRIETVRQAVIDEFEGSAPAARQEVIESVSRQLL
jgi:hypothetical protein